MDSSVVATAKASSVKGKAGFLEYFGSRACQGTQHLFCPGCQRPHRDLTAIRNQIEASGNSFFSRLFSVGRSAYVGIRYGYPLTGGSGVISKAKDLGLFGEFRSGLLDGLKVSFDKLLKKEIQVADGSEALEWSRFQLGYSWGNDIDLGVFNWIDVTPRLGVTNFSLEITKEI